VQRQVLERMGSLERGAARPAGRREVPRQQHESGQTSGLSRKRG
jgi:hypothetical protein